MWDMDLTKMNAHSISGWWFETLFIFHILGIIIPTDFHIFQRGSNHQPDIVIYIYSIQYTCSLTILGSKNTAGKQVDPMSIRYMDATLTTWIRANIAARWSSPALAIMRVTVGKYSSTMDHYWEWQVGFGSCWYCFWNLGVSENRQNP